jgi:hypothetical protein
LFALIHCTCFQQREDAAGRRGEGSTSKLLPCHTTHNTTTLLAPRGSAAGWVRDPTGHHSLRLNSLLQVGCKVRLTGAALDQPGGASDPLAAAAAGAALRVGANGCSPVAWDTRLGHTHRPLSLLPLCGVHPAGGTIPFTVLLVQVRGQRSWRHLLTPLTPEVSADDDDSLGCNLASLSQGQHSCARFPTVQAIEGVITYASERMARWLGKRFGSYGTSPV